MLSTQAIKNVGQASHYFLGHDNYYTEERTLAEEHSQWWGKGGQTLGLSGHVETTAFSELLAGKLPNGQQLGVVEAGKIEHRSGFDLTFSAPKSVFVLALLGGDERIFKAIDQAADKALALIERDLAKARVTHQGVTEFVPTKNLVVARFLHDLSRDGDPQLHAHCVVMNMTQKQDGNWRSLASQMGHYGENAQQAPKGFLEGVRHHKKYYGAVFRAELAYEMKQLGYEVVKTGNQGFFEIAGISAETIEAFSERRQAIEGFMQERGLSGAKAAAVATLETRQAKANIQRRNIRELWESKSSQLGTDAFVEAKVVVENALQPEKNPLPDVGHSINGSVATSSARQALKDAIAHLSITDVALRENYILQYALQNNRDDHVSVNVLLKALDELKTEPAVALRVVAVSRKMVPVLRW